MLYVPKRPPRVKQKEALEFVAPLKVAALLMAMRTGKTKVVLDRFGQLVVTGAAMDLLVIAPGGAYRPWDGAQDAEFSDDLRGITKSFTWISAEMTKEKSRLELAMFLAYRGPRVFLINVEALSTVQKAREAVLAFLDQRPGMRMCAVDESTIIKNWQAKRTKFILQSIKPRTDWRFIMSGLPSPRSPLDIFSQFQFLDEKIIGCKDFFVFRARYAITKKVQFDRTKRSWTDARGQRHEKYVKPPVTMVVGYRNLDDLQAKIAPYSFRVLLSDCYDLPASSYAFRDVTMTSQQSRMYKELKEFATAQIDAESHVTASIVITQMLRLHQLLCGFTRDELGHWHDVPENRTQELLNLLNEYDGKAIIWCSYDRSIHRVVKALQRDFGENSVSRFWGGNVQTREQEEHEFKTNPERRWMVATPDAGGRGRDWSVANLVAYYSTTNDLEKRDQSEERPKAVNKDVPIQYWDFRVPGTIEDKIVKALRGKINLSQAITGDNWREWLV